MNPLPHTNSPPEARGWPLLQGDWLDTLSRGSAKILEIQARFAKEQGELWQAMLRGESLPAVREPGDRRFSSRAWSESPYYDYLRRSYLLAARYFTELGDAAELDEKTRFAMQQSLDAMSPANFAATNPDVLRRALESHGESLAQGLAHVMLDARKGRLSQSDESAFEVGRNLAVTPGQVVFENDLMQLIQYDAATPEVGARPLVMVPPCINKYYILDLQAENSFVAYAVSQGHTVFMVSWRNVGPEQGHYGWDDYLKLGIFEAFRVAREISGAEQVNALGFCVGGTLLGAALAVMAARGDGGDNRSVESVTYLTTMLDFEQPGQLGLFIDEPSVALREMTIGKGGILPGADLAFVFSSLRANDLIWPYVVNNYLKGEGPSAFDLLYWNADSTNLPGPMYCSYVRNTYLENKLRVPGALQNCGVPVDLGKVGRPSFILATREDHIVPWRAAYRSLGLLGGEKTFVLGASGHVAGVINPAGKNKRSYWSGGEHMENPEQWLEQAGEHPGSWWTLWAGWLEKYKGEKRPAPKQAGNAHFRPIEPAPGRYVKQKANSGGN